MNSFPSKISAVKAKSLWLLLLSVILAISCGTHNETNANVNANPAAAAGNENSIVCNDDIAALGSQVLLPFVPEEACFIEENVKDSNDKKLTAVMKFTPEDAGNLLAQAEKHRPAEAAEIGAEKWFPEELVAQSQLSGDALLKGSAYAPTDFIQLPYKSGRLIRVENSNYFVLELATN